MSDDHLSCIYDANRSLARKRLACELRIIVAIQVVGLCIIWLSVFLLVVEMIPNYSEWDVIHSLDIILVTLGNIMFLGAAFFGGYKLVCTAFLSLPIRLYAGSVFGLPLLQPFVFRLMFPSVFAYILCDLILPLYSILPQFFIARWLAKETADGTMESV